MRRILFAMALALGTSLAVITPAAANGAVDSVKATRALVNKVGGVSVQGTLTCAGTAAQIRAGSFQAQDGDGNWVPVDVQPGDKLILLTNPDFYTVTQPVSRKSSVTVTHRSSQATPCYTELSAFSDGTPITCAIGAVCTWRASAMGYDQSLGPWFDYSASGRFSRSWLNVTGYWEGLYIAVVHEGGTSTTDYSMPEGEFTLPYNDVVKGTLWR